MKNKVKLCLVVLPLMSIVSCGSGGSNGEQSGKFNITIATFDGGVGTAWLKESIKTYEALNQDYTDPNYPDKQGIHIIIDADRGYAGENLTSSGLKKDIYFTENVPLYELINKGYLLDMSDTMTSTNPYAINGESVIADKLETNMKNFLNFKGTGKYYAIPYYDALYGFVYNVTMWKEKGFYIKSATTKANGELSVTFTKNINDAHAGPDGDITTLEDNGLPATYEEFNALLKKIRSTEGITPILTSSAGKEYPSNILANLWATYEGYDETMLSYNFSGTATHLVPLETASAKEIQPSKYESKEISFTNGYDLLRQAGRYQSLHFAKDILLSDSKNFETMNYHTDAQYEFVDGQDYAMLIEGSWWESEASSALEDMDDDDLPEFAIMPLPHVGDSVDPIGNKQTIISAHYSYSFINSATKYPEICKDLMAFLHTDEQMSHFTTITKITKPLKYSLTEEDYNTVYNSTGRTYKEYSYLRSCLHLKETSNIIYPVSSITQVVNHWSDFRHLAWINNTTIKNSNKNNSWDYLSTTNESTAYDYFRGEYDYYYNSWKSY